ncbi:MAG: DoxX family protein [Aeromicrobium sp.]|uniref:DoxX family protein n=1 Tax=Aeromicrobium sp. TaxID=1871063 RepID=UPI0039E54A92
MSLSSRTPSIRSAARPLLASMFVVGGLASLRGADDLAPAAAPVADAVAPLAPSLPVTPTNLVRAHGALNVVAGLGLATGRLPRVSAFLLALGLVPATVRGHRFWEQADPAERANQQIHFAKNVSLLGGLLYALRDKAPRQDRVDG